MLLKLITYPPVVVGLFYVLALCELGASFSFHLGILQGFKPTKVKRKKKLFYQMMQSSTCIIKLESQKKIKNP